VLPREHVGISCVVGPQPFIDGGELGVMALEDFRTGDILATSELAEKLHADKDAAKKQVDVMLNQDPSAEIVITSRGKFLIHGREKLQAHRFAVLVNAAIDGTFYNRAACGNCRLTAIEAVSDEGVTLPGQHRVAIKATRDGHMLEWLCATNYGGPRVAAIIRDLSKKKNSI